MKLLIFSDSHGNVANMADVVRLESPDRILHLGDMARDAEDLARAFPQIPVTYVPGNCDGRRPDLPEERIFTLDGCRILMTHGHAYHVKMGIGLAVRAAREAPICSVLAIPMRRFAPLKTGCGSSIPARWVPLARMPMGWLYWRTAEPSVI